jgi:hypothetical protein
VTTSRLRAVLAILLLAAATAAASDLRAEMAVRDSLRTVAPSHRAKWLQARGRDASVYLPTYRPDSANGLRLVGKYGRGPALSVTGQDSLVFVAMGSEVAVVDAAVPSIPHVLAEIQLGFRPSRVRVRDSLLLVCGAAVEMWSIATPSQPRFISRLPMSVYDFCVCDSLLFLMSKDTFMVYNIAVPESPQRLGAYPDSGYATTMTGNTVVIMLASGLGFVDVSNPASPHRVGSYGGYLWSACARGNICCMTAGNPNQPTWLQLEVIDISDPASAFPLGSLDSAGGYDLAIEDSMLYASGYYTGNHEFQIISLGDSAHPRRVGACLTYGENCGVWVDAGAQYAYIADRHMGLAVIDATVPASPAVDTAILRADQAVDVSVRDGLAFVADYSAGHKVLDVTNPGQPTEIGLLDSLGGAFHVKTVAVDDSFLFADWNMALLNFRSIDITDPTHPTMGGGVNLFNPAEDIVLRDSFAYVAEVSRFQIINVARPREPALVGSCVLQGTGVDVLVRDTLAYVSSLPTQIVNISNPSAPVVVGTMPPYGYGVAIMDTFLFLPAAYDSLLVYSVANPAAPVRLARMTFSGGHVGNQGVVLIGSRLYAGGDLMHVVDVADPVNPVEVGSWRPPYDIRRLCYAEPYIYAAAYDAGVCVLETLQTGIAERPPAGPVAPRATAYPSLTTGLVTVEVTGPDEPARLELYDAAGIRVQVPGVTEDNSDGRRRWELNLSRLPAGVYMLRILQGGSNFTVKVARARR